MDQSHRGVTGGTPRISLERARQLAVMGQVLDDERPSGLVETVAALGRVQIDPTSVVARTEHLVLWSRLGARFAPADLDRALYAERALFEYWAHIVPMSEYALHREAMRRFADGGHARADYTRRWLAANASFRRYVLRELRRRGPLRSRDLEDRAVVSWRTGGWNEGKNLSRMLDLLWFGGAVAIVGREGSERVYDLAERWYPVREPRLRASAGARFVVERNLRLRGIARRLEAGRSFGGGAAEWERALDALEREGVAIRVGVDGLSGEWFAHAEQLERPFVGRTAILSPFDQLVSDRDRAEKLFGFLFRLEIYVPIAKRRWGYYVLPVLHGDRLVARLDAAADREAGVLRLHAVHVEPGVGLEVAGAVGREARALGSWLGLGDVAVGSAPRGWKSALER